MATIGYPARFGRGTLAAAVLSVGAFGSPALADSEGIPLASHRAIYDLKLGGGHGRRALESVRGRIVYDFAGNACEGYALQFRQVTELNSGEGKVAVSDLRSTTWEDASAKIFRFNSQNYLNDQLVESVDGKAEKNSDGATVSLKKPQNRTFDVGNVVFPTEQVRAILAAAHAGKALLELAVYDGSENGQKIYQSLSVIGHKIPPDNDRRPADAAATQAVLSGLDRWPVTISYFEKAEQGGEQMPVYSLSFELYDNGVSRALTLDYGDFSVSGEMTSIELKPDKTCK